MTDAGHRRALVDAADGLGGLDLLVNNASTLGVSPLPPLTGYPDDRFREVLETDVVTPQALVQVASRLLCRFSRPASRNANLEPLIEGVVEVLRNSRLPSHVSLGVEHLVARLPERRCPPLGRRPRAS